MLKPNLKQATTSFWNQLNSNFFFNPQQTEGTLIKFLKKIQIHA